MPKERIANAKIYEQGVRAAVEVSKANLRRVILQCGAKVSLIRSDDLKRRP